MAASCDPASVAPAEAVEAPRVRLTVSQAFSQTAEGRLYLAAKNGDVDGVHAARCEGAQLGVAHPEFGSPPLVIAALHGHLECVHYLLEEDADIEIRNKFGWTPLLAAASRGYLTLAGYLVSRSANVKAQDNLGRTPLHNAVASGCDDLAKGLIEEQADVHAKMHDGKTVLSLELARTQRSSRALEDLITERLGLPFPKGQVKAMLANKKPALALLFAGQGSQRLGMLGWAEEHETAWPMIQRASQIVGYDIFELTEMGPQDKLDQVDVAQVAVFVGAMCALEWLKDQEGQDVLKQVHAAAGLSCGELAALCVAGCMDFEDGVALAHRRAQLQLEAAASTVAGDEGGESQRMLSVLGLSKQAVQTICEEATASTNGSGGLCCIVNDLYAEGFILSGTSGAVDAAKAIAKERGAQKVSEVKGCSAAFHTELMKPAEGPFRDYLVEMVRAGTLRSPVITVYSSQTGKRWLPGTPPLAVADGLVQGLTSASQWEETCVAIIEDGVERFWEVGPMKQLKAIMRHIDEGHWKSMQSVDC
eukprot:TRINITY_DN23913_c0_g1_i1.p1 TRINITY_DN23913_c0_g1~~TRINITY_DN23913_c0_g1_i1.p1  ORF type:complete len:534 (+),score=115.37 TRINITY_DN23913_c0_g1_i1:58-1659(+)